MGEKTILNVPVGLTLFLRRGMPGWIQAWNQMEVETYFPTVQKGSKKIQNRLPEVIQSELSILLADMVWQIQEGSYGTNGESKS